MRVLIAHPWDNIGGVCQVVNSVARHLQRQGHAVHLLLGGDRGLLPEPARSREGFPAFLMYLRSPLVHDRPMKSRSMFGATFPLTMSALVALVRRLGIDVVNVHYPVESGIYFSMLRRCTRIRLVTS